MHTICAAYSWFNIPLFSISALLLFTKVDIVSVKLLGEVGEDKKL